MAFFSGVQDLSNVFDTSAPDTSVVSATGFEIGGTDFNAIFTPYMAGANQASLTNYTTLVDGSAVDLNTIFALKDDIYPATIATITGAAASSQIRFDNNATNAENGYLIHVIYTSGTDISINFSHSITGYEAIMVGKGGDGGEGGNNVFLSSQNEAGGGGGGGGVRHLTNIRGQDAFVNINFRTTQINLYTTAGEITDVDGLVFEITNGSNTASANFGEGGNGGDGSARPSSWDTTLGSSGGGGALWGKGGGTSNVGSLVGSNHNNILANGNGGLKRNIGGSGADSEDATRPGGGGGGAGGAGTHGSSSSTGHGGAAFTHTFTNGSVTYTLNAGGGGGGGSGESGNGGAGTGGAGAGDGGANNSSGDGNPATTSNVFSGNSTQTRSLGGGGGGGSSYDNGDGSHHTGGLGAAGGLVLFISYDNVFS